MKTVAVIQQKGGVGKTTIATALAVAASAEGRQAAVFDLDPQGSAAFWGDTRQSDTPAVVSVQPVRLRHMLDAAREAGTDLVVIDAPPIAKDVAYQAAEQSDYILVPTRPSVLDVMAMTETLKLIRRATEPPVRHGVVLTFCPLQGRELTDTEEAVRALGAAVAPVRLHNRIAYSRAQQSGQSALEYEPDGKAADELRQLYAYVRMNIWTSARKKRAAA